MPVIDQQGRFVAGTYGYPIEGQLSPLVTNIFAGVTALTMDLWRPDSSVIEARSLPLPDSITDVNGKLQFTPEDGDLTINGIYTVQFYVTKANSQLVFKGDFEVTDR
jgi:hypothetical protein